MQDVIATGTSNLVLCSRRQPAKGTIRRLVKLGLVRLCQPLRRRSQQPKKTTMAAPIKMIPIRKIPRGPAASFITIPPSPSHYCFSRLTLLSHQSSNKPTTTTYKIASLAANKCFSTSCRLLTWSLVAQCATHSWIGTTQTEGPGKSSLPLPGGGPPSDHIEPVVPS